MLAPWTTARESRNAIHRSTSPQVHVNKRGPMLQLVSTVETADALSYSGATSDVLGPRARTRWHGDSLNLRNAASSVSQAGDQLAEAYRHHAADSARSRSFLDYSLDQAALAVGLLSDFLRRHGRTSDREVVDDSEPVDAESLVLRRARKSDAKAKSCAKRYAKLRADGKCVKCTVADATPGKALCSACKARIAAVKKSGGGGK